jgi:hypothetical protein
MANKPFMKEADPFYDNRFVGILWAPFTVRLNRLSATAAR